MAVTSSTYDFSSLANDKIVTEAYQRLGMTANLVEGELVEEGIRVANLILSSWMNRGLNLWTKRTVYQNLTPGVAVYNLAPEIVDITEAFSRLLARPLSGVAFSSSGVAANAFDNNSATACTQNAADGYIGYDFLNPITIRMVGVQSNSNDDYTLSFQASTDNINWTTLLANPITAYTIGQNQWYEIFSPLNARYFRILETGGATLNIQELYFDIVLSDLPITPMSREDYSRLTNKYSTGRPLCYCMDRQIKPIFSLWLVPTAQYPCMVYNCKKTIQDFGSLINTPEIPQRFFNALVAEMAAILSHHPLPIPIDPIKRESLERKARELFDLASIEDTEKYVPLRISPDLSKYKVR